MARVLAEKASNNIATQLRYAGREFACCSPEGNTWSRRDEDRRLCLTNWVIQRDSSLTDKEVGMPIELSSPVMSWRKGATDDIAGISQGLQQRLAVFTCMLTQQGCQLRNSGRWLRVAPSWNLCFWQPFPRPGERTRIANPLVPRRIGKIGRSGGEKGSVSLKWGSLLSRMHGLLRANITRSIFHLRIGQSEP